MVLQDGAAGRASGVYTAVARVCNIQLNGQSPDHPPVSASGKVYALLDPTGEVFAVAFTREGALSILHAFEDSALPIACGIDLIAIRDFPRELVARSSSTGRFS